MAKQSLHCCSRPLHKILFWGRCHQRRKIHRILHLFGGHHSVRAGVVDNILVAGQCPAVEALGTVALLKNRPELVYPTPDESSLTTSIANEKTWTETVEGLLNSGGIDAKKTKQNCIAEFMQSHVCRNITGRQNVVAEERTSHARINYASAQSLGTPRNKNHNH